MEALILLLVIGTSMWVAADASALAGRGTGKVGGTSTAVWVIGCLLLWIIAFPFYLVQRSTFLAGHRPPPPPAFPTKATLTDPGQRPAPPQPATLQTSPRPPLHRPGSVTEELERLALLHEGRHLTDEEFAALKTRLLS